MTTTTSELFAIVDTASDPRLFGWVTACREYQCLFSGKLEPPLQAAAPYLVKLSTESLLYKAWQNEGWGKNWGIFCSSTASIHELRKHFRQFLSARLPDGMIVQFRFYDPRVWRIYINTCNQADLKNWFAHVLEYTVEAEGGTHSSHYKYSDGVLMLI